MLDEIFLCIFNFFKSVTFYDFLFYFFYIGFTSSFIELFAWVMTMPAYQALYDLLLPDINPYGWGYDLWYDNYARVKVPGKKF